jgi:hypothetical protein
VIVIEGNKVEEVVVIIEPIVMDETEIETKRAVAVEIEIEIVIVNKKIKNFDLIDPYRHNHNRHHQQDLEII